MKSAIAALLLVFLGGFAPLAAAAPAESLERIVHLTDGALYRGEILESVPQSHVTLLLVSGEVRRFKWSQVRRVSLVASSSASWPVSSSPEVPPQAVSQPQSAGHEVPVEKRLSPSAEPPAPLAIQPIAPPSPLPVPSPSGVSAIEDPAAHAHLQQGDQAFAARSYQEALAHYRKAAEVSGSPRIHALLAKAYRKRGHFAQAYDEYRAYLASDASLSLAQRQQIQARMTEMLRRQDAFAALPPEARTHAAFVSVRSPVPGLRLQTRVVRRELEDGHWFSAEEKWRTVCQEDCNAPIPRHSTLRILSKEVEPAPIFTLPAEDRDAVVHVRPYAKNVRSGAFAMMGTGIVISLVGAGLMGAFATARSMAVPSSMDRTPTWAGLGLFLGGTGVALGSIPVFFAARPSVRIE